MTGNMSWGAFVGLCTRETVKMTFHYAQLSPVMLAVKQMVKELLVFMDSKCSLSHSHTTIIKSQVKSS